MPPVNYGHSDGVSSSFDEAFRSALEPSVQASTEERVREQVRALSAAEFASGRPGNDSRFNDYRNPQTFQNPYQDLQGAHDSVRAYGVQAATGGYGAAIRDADLLNQRTINADRKQTGSRRSQAEQALEAGWLSPGEAQRLQGELQYLRQREQALYELYLAPATARANMAFACIRSGLDSYVAYGEQLLAHAIRLRPEIELDPHYQQHKRDAYLELQRKRCILGPGSDWDMPPTTGLGAGADLIPVSPAVPPGIAPGSGGDVTPAVPIIPPGVAPGTGGDVTPAVPIVPPGVAPDQGGNPTGGETQNPSDQSQRRWLSPEDLKWLAQNPAAWLALAAAGWVIVKQGSKWFLERKTPSPADPSVPPVDPKDKDKESKDDKQEGKDQKDRESKDDKQEGKEQKDKESKEDKQEGKDQKDKEPKDDKQEGKEPPRSTDAPQENVKVLFKGDKEIDGKKVSVEVAVKLKPDGSYVRDSDGDVVRRITYEINGRKYVLEGSSWFHAPNFTPTYGDVKLHVTTVSAQDLARVQATLIPELFEAAKPGGPLHGKLHSFKTINPVNGVDPKQATWGEVRPGDKGQDAKGFTIYAKDELAAKEIYDWISAKLAEKGLKLEGHEDTTNVGDRTRDRDSSNRVSIERDHFAKGHVRLGDSHPDLLSNEQVLAEGVKDYAERKVKEKAPGWDILIYGPDGNLTDQALERFLQEAESNNGSSEQSLARKIKELVTQRAANKTQGWDFAVVDGDGKLTSKALNKFLRQSEVVGAVVEEKLAEGIKEYIQRKSAEKAQGWDFPILEKDGRLTQQALQKFLRECEVDGRECALVYERTQGRAPRLVFVSEESSSNSSGSKYYLDESNARKKPLYDSRTGEPIRLLTDRPAYYRISEQVGSYLGRNLDPAFLAAERRKESYDNVQALLDRVAKEGKEYVSLDGKHKIKAVPMREGERVAGSDWIPFKEGDFFAASEGPNGRVAQVIAKELLDSGYKSVEPPVVSDNQAQPDKGSQDKASDEHDALKRKIDDLTKAQKDAAEKIAELEQSLKQSNESAEVKKTELLNQIQELTAAQQESQRKAAELTTKLQDTTTSTAAEKTQLEKQIQDLTKAQEESQGRVRELQKKLEDSSRAAEAEKAQLQRQVKDLTKGQQEAREKASELQRKLQEAGDAAKLSAEEKTQLEKQVQDLARAQQEAQNKADALQRQLREAETKSAADKTQLERQVQELTRAQKEYQDKVGELQAKLQEAAGEKAQLQRELQGLQRAQQEAQTRQAELERKLKETATATATEKEQLNKQIEDLTRAQRESQARISELQTRMQESSTTSAQEKTRLEKQVQDLTTAQQEAQAKVAQLKQKMQESAAAAAAEKSQAEQRIQDLTKSKQEAEEKIVELRKKLQDAGDAAVTTAAEREQVEKRIQELLKSQQEAQAKVTELQKQLQDSATARTSERLKLEQQVQELTAKGRDAEQKVADLQAKMKEAGEKAEAERARLERQASDLTAAHKEAQSKVDELERKLNETAKAADQKKAELEKQVQELKTAQQQSEQRVEDLQRKMKEQESASSAEKGQLERQIQDLTRGQQEARNSVVELQEKLKQAGETLKGATADKAKLEQQIGDLAKAQQEAQTKINQLETKLREDGKATESEKADLRRQILDLQKTQQEAQTRILELQKQVKDSGEAVNRMAVEKARLETQVQDLTRQQQESQGRIAELQSKLKQSSAESEQLGKQVKSLTDAQQESQRKMEDLQKRLKDAGQAAAAEKTRLEKQVQDLTQANSESQTKAIELKTKIQEAAAAAAQEKERLDRQVQELTREQAESKKKIEELQTKLKEGEAASAEMTRLRDQVTQLEAQLKEAETKLKDAQRADDAGGDKATRGPSEVEIRGIKIKVGFEAQVGDAKWKVVGQDPADGHLIIQKSGAVDLTNKKLQSLEDGKFHKVKIMGGKGEYYRREGTDEIYKVVTVDRTLGGEKLAGHKFIVLVDEVAVKGPRSPVVSSLADAAAAAAQPKPAGEGEKTGTAFGETDKIELSRSISRELTLENGVATFRGKSVNLVEMASKSIKEKKELLDKIEKRLAKTDGQADVDPDLPQSRDELVQLQKDLKDKLAVCEAAHDEAEKHGNFQPLHELAAKELPDRIAEAEHAARTGEGRAADPHGAGGGGRWRACLFVFAAALPLVLIKPAPATAAPLPPVYAPTIPSK